MEHAADNNMPDIIPLEAFLGQDMEINPVTKGLVAAADLIIGVDVMSRQEYVVYGKAALKRISQTGKGEDLHILRVGIDGQTEDLDKLCGLVMALKGRYDFGRDWEDR